MYVYVSHLCIMVQVAVAAAAVAASATAAVVWFCIMLQERIGNKKLAEIVARCRFRQLYFLWCIALAATAGWTAVSLTLRDLLLNTFRCWTQSRIVEKANKVLRDAATRSNTSKVCVCYCMHTVDSNQSLFCLRQTHLVTILLHLQKRRVHLLKCFIDSRSLFCASALVAKSVISTHVCLCYGKCCVLLH